MPLKLKADPLPLKRLPNGMLRVAGTRVGFDLVIYAFQQGKTPEQIVQEWDTLSLADVYTLLGYYLRHRDEVDEYIRWHDEEGDKIQRKIEATQPDPVEFRERLLARYRELTQDIAKVPER